MYENKPLDAPKTIAKGDEEIFRPIHYLGSKLRILDSIEAVINEIDPSVGRVCDLFSGSGSVSFKLSKSRPVTSVDIQKYSQIICSALLKPVKLDSVFIDDFISKINESSHYKTLVEILDPLIRYEKRCIDNALSGVNLEPLCDIIENGSIISFELSWENKVDNAIGNLISTTLTDLKSHNLLGKETIAIRYFGGIYFSYSQAMKVDAILEEISNSLPKYQEVLSAALLSTVSDCVNTVGKQFAQPLKPRKANGDIKTSIGKAVQKDRSIDVLNVFKKWLTKYSQISENIFCNQVLKMDFSEALGALKSDTKVVYADPPYTREHYSRFYHVLETISLRDTPQVSTMVLNKKIVLSRGLYRENRYQSPFCIRSKAPEAFETLFSEVSKRGVKLVLSYSPYDETKKSHPRVITIKKLTALAEKYFNVVNIVSTGNFVHSKLNNSAKHLEASSSAEILIVCFNQD